MSSPRIFEGKIGNVYVEYDARINKFSFSKKPFFAEKPPAQTDALCAGTGSKFLSDAEVNPA